MARGCWLLEILVSAKVPYQGEKAREGLGLLDRLAGVLTGWRCVRCGSILGDPKNGRISYQSADNSVDTLERIQQRKDDPQMVPFYEISPEREFDFFTGNDDTDTDSASPQRNEGMKTREKRIILPILSQRFQPPQGLSLLLYPLHCS